jgi:hypothetical protein
MLLESHVGSTAVQLYTTAVVGYTAVDGILLVHCTHLCTHSLCVL